MHHHRSFFEDKKSSTLFSQATSAEQHNTKKTLTPAYLAAVLRIVALQNKPYTTLEEDREIELLNLDPEIMPYLKRILELEFKENRNDEELRELNLLLKPETRRFANRILELDKKNHKNYLEDIEADLLKNPVFRPYYDEFLPLAQKLIQQKLTSAEEERACFLFLNPYSIRQAREILALEKAEELSDEEVLRLSKNYLIRIAQVPQRISAEIDKNYQSAAFDPSHCLLINKRMAPYSKHIARFLAIQQAFMQDAKALVSQYYLHVLNKQKDYILSQDKAALTQSLLESPSVKAVLERKTALLALVLERIFFDFGTPFSQDILSTLTNHLGNALSHQQLLLNANEFQAMFKLVQQSLNQIELSEEHHNRLAF